MNNDMIPSLHLEEVNEEINSGIKVAMGQGQTLPHMKSSFTFEAILSIVMFLFSLPTTAQDLPKEKTSLTNTILHYDSLFWQAYNVCDTEVMETFLTEDVEFYHDKAGLTTSRASLFESIRSGLCGNPDMRLRREVVPGSIAVFPLENYGAILSGEHVFYVVEKGKKERLDGHAKFTHVWRYRDNEWKMHRILSYDHGPAPYINKRKEISLPAQVMIQYAGQYKSEKAGLMTIEPDGTVLRLRLGDFQPTLFAEAEDIFFLKERDLQFEFIKEGNRVTTVLILENGVQVETASKLNH